MQIEELINKWSVDLEEQEQMFMRQANQVNQWDKLLMSNAEQVLGQSVVFYFYFFVSLCFVNTY